MHKLKTAFSFILILLLFTIIHPLKKAQASVDDFIVNSFTADYYLSKDSSNTSKLTVREEIVAEFPNFDQNHGILRAIPKSYQDHTVSLVIKSVTDEQDRNYQYTTQDENDNLVLKIGNPNQFVQGTKTYIIKYELQDVINFQELDEFYWDVNGDQWKQPFTLVTANLHLTKELAKQYTGDKKCYTGIYGSLELRCTITEVMSDAETVISSSVNNLLRAENLSIVVGFKKGTFELGPEVVKEKQGNQIKAALFIAAGTVPPILALLIFYPKWRAHGKDPKGKGVIVPEYTPLKVLTLLESSYLIYEKLPISSLSATIIELAISGYLRIIESTEKKIFKDKKTYQIEIIKSLGGLKGEHLILLNALFSNDLSVGKKIDITSQKSKLVSTPIKISKSLSKNLVSRGLFVEDVYKARRKYLLQGILAIIIGFVTTLYGFVIAGIIILIINQYMPKRTPEGVEKKDYLLGLEHYLKMAEKDRINYLQSPEGAVKTPLGAGHSQQVKLYESLLPYAIIFGQEKEWSKQFKDLYVEPPNWYSGSHGTFNTIYLSNSLASFNSVSSSNFSAPSSSGSSGFSGGGGSGGGGGGGGGGGW